MRLHKKILSFLMATAMIAGLMVPASAAETTGKLVVDGKTYTGTSAVELAVVGETDIDKVTVASGDTANEYDAAACRNGTSATIGANKTGYKIYSKTENGFRHIMFELTTSIRDEVTVTTATKEVYYNYYFNSGFLNTNNNRGGSSTCTSQTIVDAVNLRDDQAVKGGAQIAVEFNPDAGQDIVKLNIRAEYADAANNIVDVPANGSKTETVSGQKFTIKNTNGKVTVSYTASRDMYITALTQDTKAKYTLNVSAGVNCSANVSSKTIVSGETASVTFTPASGYVVSDIIITANGKSGTIGAKSTSVTVDGKSYSVSRGLNGTATLSIPAVSSDVAVSATTSNDIFYVSVSSGRYAMSDQDGTTFVRRNDSFSVTFEAEDTSVLETVTIKTPRGTYTANANDLYIVVDGNYYRMYSNYAGDVTIYLTNISANMEISVDGKDTTHRVTLKTDNGAEATDKTTYYVDDGDTFEVSFEPTKSKWTIDELKVNYGGSSYTADPTDDTYIRVDGTRWPITVDRNGKVTLRMVGIERDVTVTANTDYKSSGSYNVNKNTDSHSNISFQGKNPFQSDDSTTVDITTDKNYIIKTIKVTVGSKSETVEPFDTSVKVGKQTFRIVWVDNTEARLYIDSFTGSVTVAATSKKGDVEKPDVTESSYHAAYMLGMGNGRFCPDNMLTRAEAVTLLCRVVDGMNDYSAATYAYSPYYADVVNGSWYAGYVNYARTKGYLNVLGAGYYFMPEQQITRAEYLALLCSFKGIDVSKASTRTNYWDVSSNHWAVKYITYASENGWVQGTGSGYFNPDRGVTRAEIATMTNHIMNRIPDKSFIPAQVFADVPYGHWAYYEIMEAAISHTIGGFNGNAEIWSYQR